MKVILEVVKVDNKFNKPTAHIKATMSDGFLAKTVFLYSETAVEVGAKKEYTAEEFASLKIVSKESKSNPGRFYNVLAL